MSPTFNQKFLIQYKDHYKIIISNFKINQKNIFQFFTSEKNGIQPKL